MHLDFLTNDVIKIQTNQGCDTNQIGHVLHFNNTNKIKQDPWFYITLNFDKGWVMEMHLTTFGNVIMWVSINSKHFPIMCKFYNNLKHLVKPQNETLSQTCFQNPPRKWQYVSRAWKQPKPQDFLTKTNTKASLIPNQDRETRKTKTRTWQVQNNNSTRFYYKNETKIEQNYDKKTYPKLVLNKLKVLKNSTSIYTHWAPSSKPIYMWFMFTHVWTMNKLKFNLKWT